MALVEEGDDFRAGFETCYLRADGDYFASAIRGRDDAFFEAERVTS